MTTFVNPKVLFMRALLYCVAMNQPWTLPCLSSLCSIGNGFVSVLHPICVPIYPYEVIKDLCLLP